jgi:hypothetical protein
MYEVPNSTPQEKSLEADMGNAWLWALLILLVLYILFILLPDA